MKLDGALSPGYFLPGPLKESAWGRPLLNMNWVHPGVGGTIMKHSHPISAPGPGPSLHSRVNPPGKSTTWKINATLQTADGPSSGPGARAGVAQSRPRGPPDPLPSPGPRGIYCSKKAGSQKKMKLHGVGSAPKGGGRETAKMKLPGMGGTTKNETYWGEGKREN